jgi:pimeloyl-ACP methyl ester carboxylesterase
MPFKDIGHNRLYYEDTGTAGPAVIFSHGFVLDRTLFARQIAELRGRYRCIAWDQRGHGMSTCTQSFSLWDGARDCLALMDALEIEQAVLVGLSQGGFISMRAAVTAPQRLRGLVLMDTAARAFPPEELAGYTAMRDAWVGSGPVGETAAAMAGLLFGADFDHGAWISRWQSRPPSDWVRPWDAILGRDEFFPRLAEIGCPSLVVHGENDGAFDVSVARELSAALPNCRGCEVIPGAPHAPPLTHPALVTRALETFLESLT